MSRGLIINGFAVLVATSLLASCIMEDVSEPSVGTDGANCISLQIITDRQTRADDTPADKAVLNSVDLFFYTSDAGDSTPAVFKWHGTNAQDDGLLNVTIPLELVEENGVRVNTLFGAEDKCKVYAVVNSSEATALVNDATEMPTISELRALKVTTAFFADKKGFDDTAGLVMFTEESPKNLADGDTTPNVVNYNADDKKATGHIYVNTPAAKIDLFVKFADTVSGADPNEEGTYQWSVATSSGIPTAETHMVNGVKSVLLGGWKWTDESRPAEEDYFDTRIMEDMDGVSVLRRLKAYTAEDTNDYPYVIEAPFYTYPNQWASASIMELRRTTLLLKVDWKHAGSEDALETYYTVPLNLEGNQLEPNKYYRVKVNINTLGGANFGKPVELTDCTLDVLDWGEAELDADIRTTRYLQVQQKVLDRDGQTYTAIMNNTETITIPFYSSHKTFIKEASIRYMTYDKADSYEPRGTLFGDPPQNARVDHEGKTTTETRNDYFEQELEDLLDNDYQGAYIDEARGTITIHHATRPTTTVGTHYAADYNGTEQYTYNSYYITIVLAHKDDPDWKTETITIKQNPPVYIEGEVNTCYNTNEDYRTALGIRTYNICGWVRVNSNSNDPSGLGGVKPIGKGALSGAFDVTSDNPVMYIITASQLNPGSKFHISDPRSNLRNLNLGGNSELPNAEDLTRYSTWTTAPHIHNGAGQTLNYYYPTVESMAQEDMYAIAPRFRMASSFGQPTSDLNRETARRRCAAYQEFGYPAGRWRLPTLGEMGYVTELSKLGYIPPLFGGKILFWSVDGSYWTAQGLYKVNDDGELEPDNASTGRVRCVYDDWYWTKEDADGNGNLVPDNLTGTAMQTFTWGDKEKNNPQKQPEPEDVPEP